MNMRLDTGKILIGRYRIVSLLGQGGFGAVYRAWDLNLKKPCAVKENFETNLQGQNQFEKEATVLASLSHPNLPRVTDHFVLSGQGQYLVMDFVEGQDLNEVINLHGSIPIRQAVSWIDQIASALDYLHNQKNPVIHRDIKPANIRVTADGRAFLVDFGLVKLYQTQVLTTPGARGVTPGFSPPEQYGQGGTDCRSDIYGLAATLYTLLTGVYPPESVQRYGQEKLIPAHASNPDVPHTVSMAIDRGMALDPDSRYQSVREFKSTLDAALSTPLGSAVVAPTAGSSTVVSPFMGDPGLPQPVSQQVAAGPVTGGVVPKSEGVNKNKLLVIGLIFVSIVIGGVALLFVIIPPIIDKVFVNTETPVMVISEGAESAILDHATPITVDPFSTPTSVPAEETTPIGGENVLSPTASLSPVPMNTYTPMPAPVDYDLAFASDRDGEFQVYVISLNTGSEKKIMVPPGYERTWWPSFCGEKVAVEAVDSNQSESRVQWVYLVSIGDETVEDPMVSNSAGVLGIPRCSPGGYFLAYSGKVDSLWQLFVTDFSKTFQITAPDSIVTGLASWPLEGNNFIFQGITSEDFRNLVYQMAGHPSSGDFGLISSGGNPALSPDGSQIVYSCESEGNDRVLCISSISGGNKTILVKIKREKIGDVNVQPSSAWSVDGQWIYFASAQDGDWDIYRIRPNGSELENLTDHWGSSNEIMPAIKW